MSEVAWRRSRNNSRNQNKVLR